MRLYSKEYTVGSTTVVVRTSDKLMKDMPRLNLPAKAIMLSGDAAFEVWLNQDETQKIEVYNSPYRTPIIPIEVFSFKIVAADTKKVTVHLFYDEQKGVVSGKHIERSEMKRT